MTPHANRLMPNKRSRDFDSNRAVRYNAFDVFNNTIVVNLAQGVKRPCRRSHVPRSSARN
jgi:hypothetical protein